MQIREQGKKVQLIRTPYDPEKKRCVQKVVHTFPRWKNVSEVNPDKHLSAEQLADLSASEMETLSAWLKDRADKDSSYDRARHIRQADENIISLADAIESDGIDQEKAGAIWSALAQLQRVLKKSGHPKPKAPKAQAPATAPGQTSLIPENSSFLPPGE